MRCASFADSSFDSGALKPSLNASHWLAEGYFSRAFHTSENEAKVFSSFFVAAFDSTSATVATREDSATLTEIFDCAPEGRLSAFSGAN
ncbi:Uncharacterised protein [Mycobacterium tuberculosis]|nr:Uncharacterised protein [Mycobacterium tuberculosis]